MKNRKSLFTFAFILFTGLQAFASTSAIYLSAKENESNLIDRVDQKDDGQFKIYLRVNGKSSHRVVNRAELAFASSETIGGHAKGQWALATNPENDMIENCQVNEIYENGEMTVYCNTLVNGGTMDSQVIHSNYFGKTQIFVAEVKPAAFGFQTGETVTLKKDIPTIDAGEKVKLEHLFTNGKALVQGKGNRFTSLVDVTDLQK